MSWIVTQIQCEVCDVDAHSLASDEEDGVAVAPPYQPCYCARLMWMYMAGMQGGGVALLDFGGHNNKMMLWKEEMMIATAVAYY